MTILCQRTSHVCSKEGFSFLQPLTYFIAGLDTTKLEDYMSDDEFEEVFEMTRAEFKKFPLWKQQKEKRAKGLF